MKSIAVLSLLASLAFAQSPDPLIPSDISSSCNSFYLNLKTNTNMAQCLQPIVTATIPFASGSSSTNTASLTASLNTVCSANACDPNLVGGILGQFYQACQAELTSDNKPVILTYDALYILGPLKKAMCEKDAQGHYCVANAGTHPTKRSLLDRRGSAQEVFVPNVTLFNQKSVAFLGLTPELSPQELCVPCTRQVMTDYTTQLGSIPYGPGMDNSLLLADQKALYGAINSKCGGNFLSGEVQAAGGLGTGAAPRSADRSLAFVGPAIAAVAAGAVALL